jgi:4-amino-4-deoxy-L-arabinose transferase-like glycosyltransferase
VGYLLGFWMVFLGSVDQPNTRSTFNYPPPDSRLRGRAWCVVPSLALSGATFWSSRNPSRTTTWLWLASLLALLLPMVIPKRLSGGVRPSEQLGRRLVAGVRGRLQVPWGEVVLCMLLLGVAVAFRLPYLERFPLLIHNDEANCGLAAQNLLTAWQHGQSVLFETCGLYFYDFPNLGFVPSALSQFLVSPNLYAHRLANVVLGTVALACLYLLVRSLWGSAAALLSLGLGATAHAAVHWSRSGIHSGHAAWAMVICSLLLWKAISTGRAYWFILAGLGLSACLVTYNAAFIAPLWLGSVVTAHWLCNRSFFRRYTASLGVAVLAALIFLAPVVAVYQRHPEAFMRRQTSLVFTSNPVSIKHMREAAGDNYLLDTLWNNLGLSALLLDRTRDSNQQYGYAGAGMVDTVTAVGWVLGVGVAVARLPSFPYSWLLAGLFLNWLVGGVLSMDAVQYSRVAGLALLVVIPPAIWGRELLEAAKTAAGHRGMLAAAILLAVGLLLSGAENFRLYFQEHDQRSVQKRADVLLSLIATEARDEGLHNATFVLSRQMPTDFRHSSYQFVAHERYLAAFDDVATVAFPQGKAFSQVAFVIPPGETEILDRLQQRFPGGRVEQRYLQFGPPTPWYTRYVVPLSGTRP